MKLKDLLLENPQDYVSGHIDKVDLLYRKKKYYLEDKHKEGKMAKYDAKEIAEDAVAVFKMIDKDMDLPEWLEAKITKSADYMNSVKDYLTHHMKRMIVIMRISLKTKGPCGYGINGKLGENQQDLI